MGGQVARGQASDVGPVVRGEEAEPPPVRHGRRIRSRMPLRPLSSGPHRVSPRSSRTRLSTRLGGTRQSSRQPARTLTGKTSRSGPLELPRGRPINLHCISTASSSSSPPHAPVAACAPPTGPRAEPVAGQCQTGSDGGPRRRTFAVSSRHQTAVRQDEPRRSDTSTRST